jgi:DNA-binding LacI/PurR family transcriptional regulator
MPIRKHEILADALTEMILNHHLGPGEKLPSQNELAEKYSMSRSCVVSALKVLSDRGVISRSPGKGIFVKGENSSARELKNITYIMWAEQNIAPNDQDNFGLEIMWGIEEESQKKGISFSIKRYKARKHSNYDLMSVINDLTTDAVIIDRTYPPEYLNTVITEDVPLVVAGRKCSNPKISYVAPDFTDHYSRLFDLFSTKGIKDIICLHSGESLNSLELLNALKGAKKKPGWNYTSLDYTKGFSGLFGNNHKLIHAAVEEIIEKGALPEVFVCESDWTAVRALETLRKNGVKVPEDVGLIGSLGLNVVQSTTPSISSLEVNAREIGIESVVAAQKLFDNPIWPIMRKIDMKFVERESFKWRQQ